MRSNPPWTCQKCGTHYPGLVIEVPGRGARRIPPPPEGDCPVCAQRRREELEAAEARNRNASITALFLRWSQIGSEYLACTFENHQPRKGTAAAVKAAKEFLAKWGDGTGRWLLLFGSPGNGKTHLGMAIRGEAERRHGVQALAITQPYLLNEIRATWDRKKDDQDADARTEEWMLDRLQQARFLLWDDLMAWPAWADDRMFALLDARYRNKLHTVFTSNHSPQELERIMGSRLWSRFAGRTIMVPVTATDYRIEEERKCL